MARDPKHFEKLPEPGPFAQEAVVRDLGDGLVLRRASLGDAEALAAFNRVVHADPPDFVPDESVAAWTRELAGGAHPRMRAEAFTIVEDVARRRIASSLCTIPQRFAFDGVELEAGMPELVGTHPDYRKRGLVAAQFEVIHRWAEERDEVLQVIDGIPFFYRQFGYAMALPRVPSRRAATDSLPDAPAPGQRVRDATERDVPLLVALHRRFCDRQLLCCPRDESVFRFELGARDPATRRAWRVVESEAGEPLAAFVHRPRLVDRRRWILAELCETPGGGSWATVAPTVLHALRETGTALAAAEDEPCGGVWLALGEEHPLYDVVAEPSAGWETPPAYAWYVRVADLPGFLARVGPVLEGRLAGSPLAGHTGRLEISSYRDGLRLVFEAGRLAAAESWSPSSEQRGDVGIPATWILDLLLGWRSFGELESWVPDCVEWRPQARPLLEALFPRRSSLLWPFT